MFFHERVIFKYPFHFIVAKYFIDFVYIKTSVKIISHPHLTRFSTMDPLCSDIGCVVHYAGADPGFVVKGGVSMRGVWGPLKVPSGSRTEPL